MKARRGKSNSLVRFTNRIVPLVGTIQKEAKNECF